MLGSLQHDGIQGMTVSEHYIEVIAHRLGMNIDHVREVRSHSYHQLLDIEVFTQINLYREGEKTPYHQKVTHRGQCGY